MIELGSLDTPPEQVGAWRKVDIPPLNIVFVWQNHHKDIFTEILASLRASLDDIGVQYTESHNIPKDGVLNLFVGLTIFASRDLSRILVGKKYIIYQMEQVTDRNSHLINFPEYMDVLRNAYQVWDYSQSNIKALQAKGISRLIHVPIGHHKVIEILRRDVKKDIDVLFYGGLNQRRIEILNKLRLKGLIVGVFDSLYGTARNEYIERSKIIINIHFFENMNVLEEARLSFLLSNRCFIISETSDHDPYHGGVIFCPASELADACFHYAKVDAEVREKIAEIGYEAIKGFNMTEIIKSALSSEAI